MGVPAHLHQHSFQDYLAVEEISNVKHEYLAGEIYAMAGGSVRHAGLSASITAMLHSQLRGRCRVYSSDLRIRALATGLASYPDVTVVCGAAETDPESADTVVNPAVLVEVLSPGTIDYDLGEKFEHYRQIPSLKAVVYVWQDRRQIEVRYRIGSESWQTDTTSGSSAIARIDALGCDVDLDALYVDAGA